MRNRINYIDFQDGMIKFGVFQLSDVLKSYPHFDSKRLNEWQQKGYITKLINGRYIFNSILVDESVLFQMANILLHPSYVSLESALSYYHFIPEQSFSVTSITTQKTKSYTTPKGNFNYQSVKEPLYFGYKVLQTSSRPILIAEPEKAILDLLYLQSNLNNKEALEALRLNNEELKTLDYQKMGTYLKLFDSSALVERFQIFKEVTNVGTV
ncbi:MAG: hypothetical protein QM610_13580 [Chitinophagaceae bacterium]